MTSHTRFQFSTRKFTTMAALALIALPQIALAQDDHRFINSDSRFYIPATSQIIAKPMLEYWTENEGAELLGLPETEAIEIGEESVQYFNLGAVRIEENGDYHRVAVGSELVRLKYGPRIVAGGKRHPTVTITTAFGRLNTAPEGESVIFDDATGHSIKGKFASAYEDLGGFDVLGSPISEAYVLGGIRTQWFEYGRLVTQGKRAVLASTGKELALRMNLDTSDQEPESLRWVYLDRYEDRNGDGTLEEQLSVFAPLSISIPSIEVDAVVEDVPIVDGVMQTPQDIWAVGWYYDLAAPGQFSNVVMAGHKDWWDVGPVVLYDLEFVEIGDMIYLTSVDGTGATYEITAVNFVDANINAGEVVRDKEVDMLTLITCGGAFDGEHYLSRIIVEAVRI